MRHDRQLAFSPKPLISSVVKSYTAAVYVVYIDIIMRPNRVGERECALRQSYAYNLVTVVNYSKGNGGYY